MLLKVAKAKKFKFFSNKFPYCAALNGINSMGLLLTALWIVMLIC